MSASTTELNAIVTGASSGIGRAIALAIAQGGGSVCISGRDAERLEDVAAAARRTARTVVAYRADLTEDAAVDGLRERVLRELPGFNVLVICSGAFAKGTIQATPVEELDVLLRTNIRTPYALIRAFLPALLSARGQIVFVNSSQGLRAGAASGPYAATQHALKALADSLREEVNEAGVRILSVYPGRTATPRIERLHKLEGRSYQPDLLMQPEDVAEVIVGSLLLPRTAEMTNVEIRPFIKSY